VHGLIPASDSPAARSLTLSGTQLALSLPLFEALCSPRRECEVCVGARSEPRTAISFPVVVPGFDPQRRRFSVSAQTRDISGSGASLEGINHLVQQGKKIEIDSWYGVERVDKNGTPRARRVTGHTRAEQ
jgi:hypothetical protein